MAVHDERMAMTPIRVVSSTRSALNPSTPRWYSAPMDGIHGSRSTNCQYSAPAGSNENHSGSDTRKPAPAVTFAIQRMVSSLRLSTNSRITAPASGVNMISDNR